MVETDSGAAGTLGVPRRGHGAAIKAVTAAALIWATSAVASAQTADRILSVPWSGLSSADVGQLYDANFRPLRRSVLADGQSARDVGDSRTYRRVETSMAAAEVQANARAWNLSASAAASSSYGYIRAIMVRRAYVLPNSADFSSLPSAAAYVISAIHYGHMFEMRVSGNSMSVSARVDALAGSGQVSAQSQTAVATGFTLGLRPAHDAMAAMTADSSADIQREFELEGDPVPILVEFERLDRDESVGQDGPTTGFPPAAAIAPSQPPAPQPARYRLAVVRIHFPDRKPNGQPWDAFGGAPDMQVNFFVGNQQVHTSPGPRDRTDYTFPTPQEFPGVITFNSTTQLRAQFVDIDMRNHDYDAGEATAVELQSGDQLLTSATSGAYVVLRVTRLQ